MNDELSHSIQYLQQDNNKAGFLVLEILSKATAQSLNMVLQYMIWLCTAVTLRLNNVTIAHVTSILPKFQVGYLCWHLDAQRVVH